jgi:hypothetical protein
MLLSGVAAAGYYAVTPVVQTVPIEAIGSAGTVAVTEADAPAVVRQARGKITQRPQEPLDGGVPLQATSDQEPALNKAISVASAHPALPVQGDESNHAQPNHTQPAAQNDAVVAATPPARRSVATERRHVRPPAVRTAVASHAASTSSGSSTDVLNSQAAGGEKTPVTTAETSVATRPDSGATAQCATSSQALGLCEAQTK